MSDFYISTLFVAVQHVDAAAFLLYFNKPIHIYCCRLSCSPRILSVAVRPVNSVYHRPRTKLYSRRIVPLSKDETTEYRSLWRCCQPPKLIYPDAPCSQDSARPVVSSSHDNGRVMDDEAAFSRLCHCIGDQQPLQLWSKEHLLVFILMFVVHVYSAFYCTIYCCISAGCRSFCVSDCCANITYANFVLMY